ncbi:mammalian cell entry protein [Mycolicibacterium duvalii]|uniref:Mammalian cell entry protein n=1 Tax=Mycolicibacterium duvalii TaxID=39688 RepID=A0A7I7JZ85_9MYCO|nr:MCE family protein [Mycolicibacterium duvalii]MCV7370942.1 MCE family protein [Mycolicibacterium duvalii]PEG41376.1 mammalian cell entry protein [Mycolicibacterium duvalii]BBX17197.1 mammalian cell entry protein [Mycolicibacterium duvalii]
MITFQERNPYLIGGIGIGLTAALTLGILNYDRLPFFNEAKDYSAHFTEASGLLPGAPVQVSGLEVGQVGSVELDGSQVLVTFNVQEDVRLGERTEAAVKTKSLLGAKFLEIVPRGDGEQDGVIPVDRTKPAYQLPDALGDLTSTISGLDTDQLSDSLAVLAETFSDTPPELRIAVQGVARFSETINLRDAELRNLLDNANKVTGVLRERSNQVVSLVSSTNALLAQLRTQSVALDQISGNIAAVTQQIDGFIAENRDPLRPALEKLNGVLALVNNRKDRVQKAIKGLNKYALGLGESVGSGPFFKAYLVNLFPGQFVQPFIDAAFSDLGLDPNVLLPTERADPQVGQPGTPALPVPFPRTGQGGEPRLTIPDAITGNPGDQGCGPPGVALPGPTGCYPYREPPAAPPPGGPPPGPPAEAPPNQTDTPTPYGPVELPAPGQQPPVTQEAGPPPPLPPGPVTVGPGAPGPAGVTPVPLTPAAPPEGTP